MEDEGWRNLLPLPSLFIPKELPKYGRRVNNMIYPLLTTFHPPPSFVYDIKSNKMVVWCKKW
jgi:hypothetical protein